MKVLVTGASGFIGTALCENLLGAGHQVTATIRPDSVRRGRLPEKISIIELGLDELSQLSGEFDAFYHLAWNGASGDIRNDFITQQKNVVYTVEAVKAAKRCGCHKFIGAGSQAEYGVVRGLCGENTTPNPFLLYGAAKLSAYHMARLVAKEENIAFVWPRIYSVYGPGENSDTLMSYLMTSFINGNSPQLTECENMWDYLFISDCANILRLLGEKELAGGQDIYNVSYGHPQKLKDYVRRARDIINASTTINFGARTSNPVSTYWLEPDVSLIRKATGFPPEVDFDAGVRMMANWMKRT